MQFETTRIHRTTRILLSAFSACTLIYYAICRLGFEFDLVIYLKIFGLALFLINVDELLSKKKGIINVSNLGPLVILILVLFYFALYPSSVVGTVIVVSGYLLFAVGLGRVFHSPINKKDIFQFILLLGLTSVFSFYAFCVYYTNFWYPFVTDNLINWVHIDALFQASIAQMLKNHQFLSTGVDGLELINYHFGSHLIVASMSKLLDVSVLSFYQQAFAPIIYPMLFKAFLFLIYDFAEFDRNAQKFSLFVFAFIFFSGFTGFLNYDSSEKLTLRSFIGRQYIYISESYTCSFIWLLSLFSTFIQAYIANSIQRLTTLRKGLLVILVLAFYIAICICKISTGFLVFCLLQYLFLRFRLYRKLVLVALNVLVIALSLTLFYIINDPRDGEGAFHLLQFINEIVKAPLHWFFILHYFWSIQVVIFTFVIFRINSFAALIECFKRRKTLLAEISIVLSICGLIPGNVLHLYVADAVYFSEPQNWISLAFVIYLCVYHGLDSDRLKTIINKNLVLMLVALSIGFFDRKFSGWFGENFDITPLTAFIPFYFALYFQTLLRFNTKILILLLFTVFGPVIHEIRKNHQTYGARIKGNISDERNILIRGNEGL